MGGHGFELAGHQLSAQHLAHGRLGDLAHEYVFARPLEVHEIGIAAMRVKRFSGHGVARLHKRDHTLPPTLVLESCHSHFVHAGVK